MEKAATYLMRASIIKAAMIWDYADAPEQFQRGPSLDPLADINIAASIAIDMLRENP